MASYSLRKWRPERAEVATLNKAARLNTTL
jgi:hypothetical protein